MRIIKLNEILIFCNYIYRAYKFTDNGLSKFGSYIAELSYLDSLILIFSWFFC